MSLYREPAWNQDICDLVEVKPDEDAIALENPPPLPGFDYQLVSPPNMADIPDWNSPNNSVMPLATEPNSFDEANQIQGNSHHINFHSTPPSHGADSYGYVPPKGSSNSSMSGSKARPSDKVSKAKSQRTKELSAQEAELMEKDDATLTEAELVLKKKAINRLAQRAFRERKESKLKELQAELLQSESERQKLLEHLEDFKRQFISIKTENQMLRSNRAPSKSSSPVLQLHSPESQEAFIEQMMHGQSHVVNDRTINKVYPEPKNPGRKVLGIGALWDYLQLKREEEEFEDVDMLDLMELLKGQELCHGYGPAYALDVVEDALQQVANRVNGTD